LYTDVGPGVGHLAWTFLENCQKRLNPGGWLVINQWATDDGKPLGAALLRGLYHRHYWELPVKEGNVILIVPAELDQELDMDGLIARPKPGAAVGVFVAALIKAFVRRADCSDLIASLLAMKPWRPTHISHAFEDPGAAPPATKHPPWHPRCSASSPAPATLAPPPSPFITRLPGRHQCRLNPQRRLPGNPLGQLDRPWQQVLAGHDFLHQPRRKASWASNSSPVSSQRIALPQPATDEAQGRAAKGKIPRCTSICAKRVLLAHRLISAASINSMPMVRQ
jgi:hypothetical protein